MAWSVRRCSHSKPTPKAANGFLADMRQSRRNSHSNVVDGGTHLEQGRAQDGPAKVNNMN